MVRFYTLIYYGNYNIGIPLRNISCLTIAYVNSFDSIILTGITQSPLV